jgi:aromatic amino acid transport protein AroP
MVSALFTLLCVLLNYIFPETAFSLLMMLVVAAIVINWVVISYTHLKFKRYMLKNGEITLFPSLFYPLSNYLCIAFMAGILVIMSQGSMRIAVLLLPCWVCILVIAYYFQQKKLAHKTLPTQIKISG